MKALLKENGSDRVKMSITSGKGAPRSALAARARPA